MKSGCTKTVLLGRGHKSSSTQLLLGNAKNTEEEYYAIVDIDVYLELANAALLGTDRLKYWRVGGRLWVKLHRAEENCCNISIKCPSFLPLKF